ncbi:hypothetical protein F5Y04DRAFT_238720 [Hypomontagnella monticulosa]|nr:hypothetical protein F5Y04DRAFT_238720 [Hypomontagnella monticulosa]
MISRTPFPTIYGAPSTLCRRCLLRSLAAKPPQKRYVSSSFLQKQEEAKQMWEEKAELIKEGKEPHLWDTFKERGLVKDIAGTDEQIRELMRQKRIGVYVGIDPTAPSLHVGHLLPLMPLFWMYMNGYRAVSLVGGATAKIGDPTDRLQSRTPISNTDMTRNITMIHYQLKRIWRNIDNLAPRYGYAKQPRIWSRAVYNNSQWYSSVPFVEVVTRLFKGMRLGPMLSRETVKRKMEKGDGMSLDEFVYPLMQAWDWWFMFSKWNVMMQIGGSDQYGNIVSGIDCIKYIRDHEPNLNQKLPDDLLHTPVGFTVPLLTDSSGAKFGKSSGNAIWLDQFKTSTFDLYGYFMRRPDADIENLLKLFTFLPLEQINSVMEEHNKDPSKRHAQHTLALEVVALVYGLPEAEQVQARHKGLFSKGGSAEVTSFPAGTPATANMAAAFQVDIKLPESLIMGKSISRILYAAGLADSVSDGNRLTQHQGAYIGGAPGQASATNKGMSYDNLTFTTVKNWFPQDTKNFLIDGKILLLRRGKHFIRVVEMVSDEEWAAKGMMYAGEPGTGRVRLLRDALMKAAKDQNLETGDSELLKKLVDGAETLYSDKESALKTLVPGRLHIEKNRARQILEQSFRTVDRTGPHSVKQKTEAIDEVLERTRRGLEEDAARQVKKSEKKSKRQAGGPEAEQSQEEKLFFTKFRTRT